MAAPPESLPAAVARRNHVSEKAASVGHALIAQMAATLRDQPGMQHVSANRLNRMVRARIALQDRERPAISYPDPTGEHAVRNVLRGAG